MKNTINTLLFDLDGTLFDTAPDIIDALNHILREHGRAEVTVEALRSRLNGGSLALLNHTFNIDEHHPDFERLKEQLLSHSAKISDYKTDFFEGMRSVLDYLDQNNIPWGIVTNRLTHLALPIVQHFGVEKRMQCLVGQDLVKKPKPHPDPLIYACKLLNIKPQQALYIGDSSVDVQAAHAAGMTSMVAAYGYIPHHEDPKDWQADYMINNPLEILDWIEENIRCSR